MIKGMIKDAHQSCAIWIKQQAIYQIFKSTVFTTKYMINFIILIGQLAAGKYPASFFCKLILFYSVFQLGALYTCSLLSVS